jgi:hypothetical protein
MSTPRFINKRKQPFLGEKMNHWYFVNQLGMATLCADKADAEKSASEADEFWPRHAPHIAMQLVDAQLLESERTARQAAQLRIEELQALLARVNAERCAAVISAEKKWRKVVMAAVKLACQPEFDPASEQDRALETALIEANMIKKSD